MYIEIAEPGRMSQSGSSLLKLIQNNYMPTLDLLVRESIQNSLDAFDKNNKNNFVGVNFKTGLFKSNELSKEFDCISNKLDERYGSNDCKFIAVQDYNTVGLTGKMSYDEIEDNSYGNLLKLVYEISKPQENAGAGGSWGLGKTVYFRVGIGLVIYYSRIINENGQYESRLAATLVEDENLRSSMIPSLENKKIKRGIAWWGQKTGENQTKPVTDEREIHRLLKVFNIEPYIGDKTGTTIIIPYIDEKKLLHSNVMASSDDNDSNAVSTADTNDLPYWFNSIESYLKIAIQRWYAPRINNNNYEYGKYLQASINGKPLKVCDMEPVFQAIQSLYTYAINGAVKEFISDKNIQIYCDEVNLQGLQSRCAGKIAYLKITQKQLDMLYPENKPSPYTYLNLLVTDAKKNKPIICYTRQPGMIVSYENMGPWVDGITSTDENEFIIGIFKLNSKNIIKSIENNYTLEEYIRKGEMADHVNWSDFSIGIKSLNIVSKLQKHVRQKISNRFEDTNEVEIESVSSGFGKLFGDALLPPENFGKKPSVTRQKQTKESKKKIERHKRSSFFVNQSAIKYTAEGIQVPMEITLKKGSFMSDIEMGIDSNIKAVSVSEWESTLKKAGCSIDEVKVVLLKSDDVLLNKKVTLNSKNKTQRLEFIGITLSFSKNGTGYKISMASEESHKVELMIYANIKIYDKNVKPIFNYKEKSGE